MLNREEIKGIRERWNKAMVKSEFYADDRIERRKQEEDAHHLWKLITSGKYNEANHFSWFTDGSHLMCGKGAGRLYKAGCLATFNTKVCEKNVEETVRFIAHTLKDIPALLSHISELEGKMQVCEEQNEVANNIIRSQSERLGKATDALQKIVIDCKGSEAGCQSCGRIRFTETDIYDYATEALAELSPSTQ